MKKREEFAVKLRREKTQKLIKEKRLKLQTQKDNDDQSPDYAGFEKFNNDQALYQKLISEYAPSLVNESSEPVSEDIQLNKF